MGNANDKKPSETTQLTPPAGAPVDVAALQAELAALKAEKAAGTNAALAAMQADIAALKAAPSAPATTSPEIAALQAQLAAVLGELTGLRAVANLRTDQEKIAAKKFADDLAKKAQIRRDAVELAGPSATHAAYRVGPQGFFDGVSLKPEGYVVRFPIDSEDVKHVPSLDWTAHDPSTDAPRKPARQAPPPEGTPRPLSFSEMQRADAGRPKTGLLAPAKQPPRAADDEL